MQSEELQMLKIRIPDNIFEQMLRQAKARAPVEACGILAGRGGQVEKLYEMKNADQSSNHFMMEPKEQFKVVKDIRASRLEMLAIYHSHPETPARPSREDIRLALTPGVTYVILSIEDEQAPVIKGFRIRDGQIVEVPVSVTKD